MKTPTLAALAASVLVLSGCAASIPPVQVTRFHLEQPLPAGVVRIEPAPGDDAQGPEYRTYAAAVGREFTRLGFTPGPDLGKSDYVAVIRVRRDSREALSRQSPVTIGIGGGSFGRSVGVGGGVSFGVGGNRSREIVITELGVGLKRQGDAALIWEGRAQAEAAGNAPAAQPGLAADKLANALFRDFPGESGRTISVK